MTIRELREAVFVGYDRGGESETCVAAVKMHKDGFQEIVWVKHGEEAAAILRALEEEGRDG